MMELLFDGLASLMAFFYSLILNYAAAIIMLTLAVMVILTPLTLKGTRSMMMMQQLQPEMKKIQTRYKDDRQKLNEELLKFYKENSINPMGGCLPLLAQMPVFIVLYTVLRGLTRRISDMGLSTGWSSGQAATTSEATPVPDLLLNFDPAYIKPTTAMYESLSQTNVMDSFGMDLSESAQRAIGQGPGTAIPYLILIALVAVTGFYQQRQIQGRMSSSQINPQQQMLMKIMPIMLPVFSFTLPAGLVLYFVVSNTYRVGQQWFISRSIYGLAKGETVDEKAKREAAEAKAAGKAKAVVASSKETGAVSKAGTAKASKNGSAKDVPAKDAGTTEKSKGSGASAPTKSKRTDPSPSSAPAGSSPVLQPRARKNKKR